MTSPRKQLPIVPAVGGILFRRDAKGQPSVLLIRKRRGYWTLPKGKLNNGENESEALIRELVEETGLSGRIISRIQSVSYKIVKRGQLYRKQVTYYLVHAEDGPVQLDAREEIVKANWFSPAAAIRRVHRGRLRVVLRHACDLLMA